MEYKVVTVAICMYCSLWEFNSKLLVMLKKTMRELLPLPGIEPRPQR